MELMQSTNETKKDIDQEVINNRTKAIAKIATLAKDWDKKMYCAGDFKLDALLRSQLKLPEKEVGKAPFEDIEL